MRAAALGDQSSDGGGAINLAGVNPMVTVNGKAIAIVTPATPKEGSPPDLKCDDGDLHCTIPGASTGSITVLAGGNQVHREGDSRGCGGYTLVSPLRTVTVN